jgi:hypothetical protein
MPLDAPVTKIVFAIKLLGVACPVLRTDQGAPKILAFH